MGVRVNENKLAMWQSLIALAYVDGELEPQEKAVLLGYIRDSKLSEEIKNELIAGMGIPLAFADVFKNVSDVQDRAHVLSAALVLFHSDADFEPAEKKIFELFNAEQRKLVDYPAAEKQARVYVAEFKARDAADAHAEFSKGGRIQRMIGYIVERLPEIDFGDVADKY